MQCNAYGQMYTSIYILISAYHIENASNKKQLKHLISRKVKKSKPLLFLLHERYIFTGFAIWQPLQTMIMIIKKVGKLQNQSYIYSCENPL